MNAKDFENHCKNLEGEGQHTVAAELRAYVAQRCDIAATMLGVALRNRLEVRHLRAELSQAKADAELDTQTTTKLLEVMGERDAAQAQLAEAVGLLEPFGKMAEGKDRWPETSGVAVFPLLSQVRPVRAFLKRIARHAQAEQQEAQGACKRPPEGWSCTRGAGHEGPCAASKITNANGSSAE